MKLRNLFNKILIVFAILTISFPKTAGAQTLDSPDLDGNGTVNGADMQMLLPNITLVGEAGFISSDINNNGKVEMADASVIVRYFGMTLASPSPSTNPSSSPSPSGDGTGVVPVKIGTGAYPAIAADSAGNAHVVYAKDGKLIYCKYNPTASPGSECPAQEVTGLTQNASYRNDPAIVIDSQNRPHVLGGTGNGGGQYAYWNGSSWIKIGTFNRDTGIAIDKSDNVYIAERGDLINFIKVYKRVSGASGFTQLTNPSVSAQNDHIYTDIYTSPTDNSVHIVYRHGVSPNVCGYTYSTNGGSSWINLGITAIPGSDYEAPSGVVANDGTVYSVCGNGTVFQRSGTTGWINLGLAVSALTRHLPVMSSDLNGNIYVSSFGGKYNIRKNGAWTGEKTVTGLSTQAKGFTRIAAAANFAYAVWEEGNSNPALDATTAAFDIVLGKIQ